MPASGRRKYLHATAEWNFPGGVFDLNRLVWNGRARARASHSAGMYSAELRIGSRVAAQTVFQLE
jgi:hypothetical protein